MKNEMLELRAMINSLYETLDAQIKLEKVQTKNIFELKNTLKTLVETTEDDKK